MKFPFQSILSLAIATPLALAQTESKSAAPSADAKSTGGLVFKKWSGDINVPDPVACSVAPNGRVYVSATTRRKAADLDIREHSMWIPDDVGLSSVEQKSAFLREQLAPGKLRQPRGGLKDQNGDGSIDWKDLTTLSERIYELRDTDGDGTADKMTVFAEGFNTEVTGIAAGVLYHDGWVYATIAPDLWRMKDTNDDGVADIREVVVHGFGHHLAYGGHDMHGLSVGLDGRIYWSIGDKGVNVKTREGGHVFYPNEGCVMRVEPDGSGFEVYAHGLRNVQEPAFDDLGDLIGVDNDADFKGEKERFVFIAEGSDAGWRCNFQYMGDRTMWMRERMSVPQWDGQAAYILPPIATSTDGPAGFKRDPGTALGSAFRNRFFLNEFPSGKMRAFSVEQDGATFKAVGHSVVHEGLMGIGMSWHSDGSLFMADWIGGYPLDGKGAVWSADVPGGAAEPARAETKQILEAGFEKRTLPELASYLAKPDRRVRLGAQMELARRGESATLLAAAKDTAAPLLMRAHGIWGYGQLLRAKKASAADLLALLRDANGEVRAQSARVLSEAELTAAQAKELIPLLADASPRARLQAGLALGRLRVADAVSALVALAENDGSQPVLRHAAAAGLAGCASAEQLVALKSHASTTVRLIAVVALRKQASARVAEFLSDAEPLVVAEAARAIYDAVGIPAALPQLAALLEKRPSNDSAMLRAINANLRAGTSEAAQRLVSLAVDETATAAARSEAFECLLAWKTPPRLDRVDGFARKFEPAPVAEGLTPKVDALLALKDPALKRAAIEVIIAHSLKALPAQISAIVADASAAAQLRAEALRLMSHSPRSGAAWESALETALAAKSPSALKQAAMELLLPETPKRLVSVAESVLQNGAPGEKQLAISLLARAAHADADTVLARLGSALLAGNADAPLQWDILAALNARAAANPALAAIARDYTASAAGASRRELVEGGNADVGQNLVQNHLGANCIACHATGDTGSTVGPNLKTIGTLRDRAYLLESLLNPSAQIAPGFGIATVTLRDQTVLSGAPLKETPTSVTLRLSDGKEKTIATADIASRTPAISVMPPMLGILQPGEIRDVVAYLASLKGKAKAKASDGH